MRPFEPTLGIKDTSKNVQAFVKEHMPVFWDIFKPLAPYILGLSILDIVITYAFMPYDEALGQNKEFSLGSLIASYFFSCLAISWHRVVIHGPDRYQPMNPFKPQKSDWAFIGMGILVFFVVPVIGGIIIGLLGAMIHPGILVLGAILLIVFVIWAFKVLFYFPAKATGNHVSLKQSYSMTKGYIWKLIAANSLAALKLFFIMIAYLIVGFILIGGTGGGLGVAGMNTETIYSVGFAMGAALMLPVVLYFQPVFTIIGITTLSNYYQHALQNKGVPE